eukprot:13821092-Ditylum_brightwellii.AAC.1
MEDVALEYHLDNQIIGNKPLVKGKFHSVLSDESDQNAVTTTSHMLELIKLLIEKNMIRQNQSTIMEEIDGFAKQYGCATEFKLLSMLAMKYNIVIDRAIGAPGHG